MLGKTFFICVKWQCRILNAQLIYDNITTQRCHNTTVSQHNGVTTQLCHNSTVSQHNCVTTQNFHNGVTTQWCYKTTVSQHNPVTTLSQHKVSQHNDVTTQRCHNTTLSQHNGVTTQHCHNSVTTQRCHNTTMSQHNGVTTQVSQLKFCNFFQERILKVLKCYIFLWVQRRHNCSPAASFTNCIMTLYLLKVHLQTFLSIPITQKYQILSCDTLVAKELYVLVLDMLYNLYSTDIFAIQPAYTTPHDFVNPEKFLCEPKNFAVCTILVNVLYFSNFVSFVKLSYCRRAEAVFTSYRPHGCESF